MVSIVECMYHNTKVHILSVNINFKNTSRSGTYRLWLKKFCGTKLEWGSKKRGLESIEDYTLKKRCTHTEVSQERVEKICAPIVRREMEQLRNCFTDKESLRGQKKRKKS